MVRGMPGGVNPSTPGTDPVGGLGGPDPLTAAIAKARGELAGVVDRLVAATKSPNRSTQAVVAACNTIIALACRESTAGASAAPATVVVVTNDALKAELDARGRGSRVLHAVRAVADAE